MNLNKNNLNILSIENLISFFLIIIIFIIDRISKIKIIYGPASENTIFVNNFLNFELLWNTGIGFGFLSASDDLFYKLISLFILLVVLFLLFIMLLSKKKIEKFLYSLILGGAIGNLYDRSTYFAVPDFIDIHIKEYHWFTFNIADIFITLGILLIILNELSIKKQ